MPPLNSFKIAYSDIVGLKYGELSISQKQTVYAMEIYKDSHDALTAFDIFSTTSLEACFIDTQNRETFGYTDNTIIKSVE